MTVRIDGTNTAANPGITGSDTDTGLTFGTDTVNVVTGGSTRTTVDSSGRLLVGTSTARTDFFSGSLSANVQVEGSSFAAYSCYATSGNGAFIFGRDGASSGSTIGNLSWQADDGTDEVEAARISGQVDGTPGANDMPGRLVFFTTASGATSPSERVRIRNNGNLRINCNNFGADVSGSNSGVEFTPGSFPVFRISSGDATSNNVAEFYNTNGQVGRIATSGSSTSYNTSSDYRLKENVVNLGGAIDRVKQLTPKRFNFIADAETTVDGFLAHEAAAVVPEAVTGEKDAVDADGNPEYQGIDQSKLVPLLTAALQEAIGKIEVLETRVAQLEGGTN